MSCVHPGCTSTGPTRPYGTGRRCKDHTPAKLAGRPEPDDLVDPTADYVGLRTAKGTPWVYSHADSLLVDQRAIASGRRRSIPSEYRAARAAEDARKQQRRAQG